MIFAQRSSSNQQRVKVRTSRPTILSDQQSWITYLRTVSLLKGRAFYDETHHISTLLYLHTPGALRHTESFQRFVRDSIRSDDPHSLVVLSSLFCYDEVLFPIQEVEILPASGHTQRVNDLIERGQGKKRIIPWPAKHQKPPGKVPPINIEKRFVFNNYINESAFEFVFGTTGEDTVRFLYTLNQKSRRNLIHQVWQEFADDPDPRIRQVYYDIPELTANICKHLHDNGAMSKLVWAYIRANGMEHLTWQPASHLPAWVKVSGGDKIKAKDTDTLSNMGPGMIDSLLKKYTNTQCRGWFVKANKELITEKPVVYDATQQALTKEELFALNFKPDEFSTIVRGLGTYIYVKGTDYNTYLMGVEKLQPLVIYIKTTGRYYVRGPDGGCWLWALFVHKFLYGQKGFALPRGAHNVPRSACTDAVRHFLHYYAVETVYCPQISKTQAHMVVPLRIEDWFRRVREEYVVHPPYYDLSWPDLYRRKAQEMFQDGLIGPDSQSGFTLTTPTISIRSDEMKPNLDYNYVPVKPLQPLPLQPPVINTVNGVRPTASGENFFTPEQAQRLRHEVHVELIESDPSNLYSSNESTILGPLQQPDPQIPAPHPQPQIPPVQPLIPFQPQHHDVDPEDPDSTFNTVSNLLIEPSTFHLSSPPLDAYLAHVDRNRLLQMNLILRAEEAKKVTQQETDRTGREQQCFTLWLLSSFMQCTLKTGMYYVNTPAFLRPLILHADPTAHFLHIQTCQRTRYHMEQEVFIQQLPAFDGWICFPLSLYTLSTQMLTFLSEHGMVNPVTILHMNTPIANGIANFFSGEYSVIISGVERYTISQDELAPIHGVNVQISPLNDIISYVDNPNFKIGWAQLSFRRLSWIVPKALGLYIELDLNFIYHRSQSIMQGLTYQSKLTYLQTSYGNVAFPALAYYLNPANKAEFNSFQEINTDMLEYFDGASSWLTLDQWVRQRIYDGTLTLGERILCLVHPSSYAARIRRDDMFSKIRRFLRAPGKIVVETHGPPTAWNLPRTHKTENMDQVEVAHGLPEDERIPDLPGGPYLRVKPVEEIDFSKLRNCRKDVRIRFYLNGKEVEPESLVDPPGYKNKAHFVISGYHIVDSKGVPLTQFEWDSRSHNNLLNCLTTRMMKYPALPADSKTVAKFKDYIRPRLVRLMRTIRIVPTDVEEWLATKTGWADGKKDKYRRQIAVQRSRPNTEAKKYFETFLKTGEQYTTSSRDQILRNTKSRSRLIFSPIRNTFGLPCLLNNLILKAMAHTVPGFCHGLTYQDIVKRFRNIRSPIIDMDASSNEYQQHGVLKAFIQKIVFDELWPQLRVAIPSISPEIIDSYKNMLQNPKSEATLKMNKKLTGKMKLDGMLQSGDPCTTWFNTLSIVLYLNYYTRNMSFHRVNGLVEPTDSSGFWVSGDDQVIWFPDGSKLWETIHKYVGPSRPKPKLQRYCDPISYHQIGEYFSFISLIISPNSSPTIIRDPQKMLMNSQVYSGRDRSLCESPQEHSALVAMSMSLSNKPGSLLSEVNLARQRMGGQYERATSELFQYRYGGRDAIGEQDTLLYNFLSDTYALTHLEVASIYQQFSSITKIGQTVVVPTNLVLDAKCARKAPTVSGLPEMVNKRRPNRKPRTRAKGRQTDMVVYNQSLQKRQQKQKQVMVPTRKLVYAKQNHGPAWGLDGPIYAWEASIRYPEIVRNVRIPAPYIARSATCHVQQSSIIAANASGNVLIMFDPNGIQGISGNPLVCTVSDATLTDGTVGTPVNKMTNPFHGSSGKPVQGFGYRVVSASFSVSPIMALTSQTGTATYGYIPGFLTTGMSTFDNLKDYPMVTQTSAVNPAHVLYEPQDPSDLDFCLINDVDASKDARMMFYLCEGGLAAGSYRWTIHVNYEFQPVSNLDYFNTTATPLGDPNRRGQIKQQPDGIFQKVMKAIMPQSDVGDNQLLALKNNEVGFLQQTKDAAISLAGTVASHYAPKALVEAIRQGVQVLGNPSGPQPNSAALARDAMRDKMSLSNQTTVVDTGISPLDSEITVSGCAGEKVTAAAPKSRH